MKNAENKRIKYLWDIAKKCSDQTNYYDSTAYYYKVLFDLRNALLNGKYYTGVKSVAKSGMSRIITIAYIKNSRLIVINDPQILKLAGCDKNGRIGGCGMDMLFAAQYNLFRAICKNYRYQDKMKRYNSI